MDYSVGSIASLISKTKLSKKRKVNVREIPQIPKVNNTSENINITKVAKIKHGTKRVPESQSVTVFKTKHLKRKLVESEDPNAFSLESKFPRKKKDKKCTSNEKRLESSFDSNIPVVQPEQKKKTKKGLGEVCNEDRACIEVNVGDNTCKSILTKKKKSKKAHLLEECKDDDIQKTKDNKMTRKLKKRKSTEQVDNDSNAKIFNELENEKSDIHLNAADNKLTKKSKKRKSIELNDYDSNEKVFEELENENSDAESSTSSEKEKDSSKSKSDVQEQSDKTPELDFQLDERTVFVGNWPVSQNKKKLKRHFKPFGDIETVRFRSIPIADTRVSKKVSAITKQFHPNRTSTNAYVRFVDLQSAIKAKEANGSIVEEHHIRVNLCNDRIKPDFNRAVFVGNINFDVEEDDLWKLFETCGIIESVRIVRDKQNGMSRGFGYVNFNKIDGVELALNLNETKLKNRALRVMRASPKNKNYNSAKSDGKQKFGTQKNHAALKDVAKSKKSKRTFQGVSAIQKKTKRKFKKSFKKTTVRK